MAMPIRAIFCPRCDRLVADVDQAAVSFSQRDDLGSGFVQFIPRRRPLFTFKPCGCAPLRFRLDENQFPVRGSAMIAISRNESRSWTPIRMTGLRDWSTRTGSTSTTSRNWRWRCGGWPRTKRARCCRHLQDYGRFRPEK